MTPCPGGEPGEIRQATVIRIEPIGPDAVIHLAGSVPGVIYPVVVFGEACRGVAVGQVREICFCRPRKLDGRGRPDFWSLVPAVEMDSGPYSVVLQTKASEVTDYQPPTTDHFLKRPARGRLAGSIARKRLKPSGSGRP